MGWFPHQNTSTLGDCRELRILKRLLNRDILSKSSRLLLPLWLQDAQSLIDLIVQTRKFALLETEKNPLESPVIRKMWTTCHNISREIQNLLLMFKCKKGFGLVHLSRVIRLSENTNPGKERVCGHVCWDFRDAKGLSCWPGVEAHFPLSAWDSWVAMCIGFMQQDSKVPGSDPTQCQLGRLSAFKVRRLKALHMAGNLHRFGEGTGPWRRPRTPGDGRFAA